MDYTYSGHPVCSAVAWKTCDHAGQKNSFWINDDDNVAAPALQEGSGQTGIEHPWWVRKRCPADWRRCTVPRAKEPRSIVRRGDAGIRPLLCAGNAALANNLVMRHVGDVIISPPLS